jgi:hypothetical protein
MIKEELRVLDTLAIERLPRNTYFRSVQRLDQGVVSHVSILSYGTSLLWLHVNIIPCSEVSISKKVHPFNLEQILYLVSYIKGLYIILAVDKHIDESHGVIISAQRTN